MVQILDWQSAVGKSKRFTGALAAAAALVSTLLMAGCAGKALASHVDDRANGDSHQWNAHEAFLHRRHWAEVHGGEYRPYRKLTRHDQDEYWSWRHTHPD
jgi:hypothetical protein